MNKYKLTLSILSLLLTWQLTTAQTFRAFEKAGAKAFIVNDYYSALIHYGKALMIEPDRMDIVYQKAEAARLFGALSIAKKSYEEVAQSEDNDKFPVLLFRIAQVKHGMGYYEEAQQDYEKFIQLNSGNPNVQNEINDAIRGLEHLDYALKIVSKPRKDIIIKHLDDGINSPYSDFNPVYIDNTLYYSSLQYEKNKDKYPVYRLTSKMLSSENGDKGKLVEGDINEENKHTAHTAFSLDGGTMYYTICDYMVGTKIRCEIYYRDKMADGKWGQPVKLPDFINIPDSASTSTQPNIGQLPDGREVLFFASNQPGTKGELDIWQSTIEAKGVYAKPVNLVQINTEKNDVTPFYHNASHTLYFSSEGYKGLGGYDIFKTKIKDLNWSAVEHTGYPLNSSYNDLYYFMNENSSKAYFSSNRSGAIPFIEKETDDEEETCCHDIYEAEMAKVDLEVLTLTCKEDYEVPLLGARVQVIELTQPEDNRQEGMDENSDKYQFQLEREMRYMVFASKQGFISSDTVVLTTEQLNEPKTFSEKLRLNPSNLEFKAQTFVKGTDEPLEGVSVNVIDLATQNNNVQFDPDASEYSYSLDYGKRYRIIANKAGYITPSPVEVELSDCRIYLEKLFLEKAPDLPISIYFDNDEPKQHPDTLSKEPYDLTFQNYIKRKETFKQRHTASLSESDKSIAMDSLDNFFELEVRGNYEKLISYFDLQLLPVLEEGTRLKLYFDGFTSPRASPAYNFLLSQRRIDSVRQFFTNYDNGKFAPYIQSGELEFLLKPLGETQSPGDVSDDFYDPANSIFSVKASRERRVQIRKESIDIIEESN